jgi:hypothetical protein
MDAIVLYLILESSTVRYVGYRVVPHTMCVYRQSGTDRKYTYYVASAIYKCPLVLRLRGGV